MKVASYLLRGNGHASMTVPAMLHGAKLCGAEVRQFEHTGYKPEHVEQFDVAIFWGYVETLRQVMKGYTEAGKVVVYIDLGYWERGKYYKVAINARHPTAYFRNRSHDDVRRKLFKVEMEPWRKQGADAHILVAGLSLKAATAEELGPFGEYEQNLIHKLQEHTTRPIIYRAKTSGQPPKLAGVRLSTLQEPLGPLLRGAWATVSRHSNVCVDGLLMGVPCFSQFGVCSVLGPWDLSKIEEPQFPSDREQFCNDVAYCQWSCDEMKTGVVWRHLQEEGLIKQV